MMNRWKKRLRDERGISFMFVGFGFMAFLACSTLAIDVGLLMTARTQAQTSADAGALAGATALVFNSFTDHTASGPAVTSAIQATQANPVVAQPPSVTPADVTFPNDSTTGQNDLVQVSVYRTQARSNPVGTLIAQLFGTSSADIVATATAMAAPANGEDCVLPWTIPDKWIEKQCGPEACPWTPSDLFDIYATQGNHQNAGAPLPNPDIYIPPGQAGSTGYDPMVDSGLQIVIKPNNGTQVSPSFYNAWDVGGVTGAAAYSNNISGCNPNVVKMGQNMVPETGNMQGPTKQGTDALIASDASAWWDTSCNKGLGCVKGSAFRVSPRIRPIPLYDPVVYANDQHSGKSQPTLTVVNYLGFFIESVDTTGAVTGRVTPITGKILGGVGNSPPPPAVGAFARAIMLVK